MIGFNHALAGTVIAATVSPAYVPFIALVSHFLMDALPHFGKSEVFKPYAKPFKVLLMFDAILCFSILGAAWWLFPEKWAVMTIGIFFATLPDFLWLIEGKLSWLSPYFTFAKRIQNRESPEGWTYEVLFLCMIVLAIVLIV